jgi:hypothetical protein
LSGTHSGIRQTVMAWAQSLTMARHSKISAVFQIVARQMIVGGLLWLWLTAVQLVILPDEWMRTVWYLAGAALVTAGALIVWFGNMSHKQQSPRPAHLQRISSLITGS